MKMRIIAIFLLAVTLSYSQNVEPFQRQFLFNGSNQFLSSTNDSLKLTNFTLGWHWGSQKTTRFEQKTSWYEQFPSWYEQLTTW